MANATLDINIRYTLMAKVVVLVSKMLRVQDVGFWVKMAVASCQWKIGSGKWERIGFRRARSLSPA